MTALLKRFLRDESGRVDGMLLSLGTGLVIVPSITEIGAKLAAVFETLTKALH
jgi:Flp pilus assembly pilin Flp